MFGLGQIAKFSPFSFKHACGELFEHFFGLKFTGFLCKYGHFLARSSFLYRRSIWTWLWLLLALGAGEWIGWAPLDGGAL